MPWSSTPTTPFTWDTASFTWNDTEAGRSWDSAAPYIHTGELLETINFAEAKDAGPGKTLAEALAISEGRISGIGKVVAEALGLAELYSSLEEFNPIFAEAFVFGELLSNGPNKALPDVLGIVDGQAFGQGLNVPEAIAFAENMDRAIDWLRTYSENFVFAEGHMRDIGVKKFETISVYDTYLRQGPLVVSDMQLRGDEVTFSEFMLQVQNNVPSGYGPFQPFIIGDYDISKALIKITMRRESTSQDLRLLYGEIFIDVADVTDRGNIVISSTAGPVSVTFVRKFLIPPTVSVTRIGSSGGAVPRITNVTKTGFQIELVDSTGTRVTGEANWQAEGY